MLCTRQWNRVEMPSRLPEWTVSSWYVCKEGSGTEGREGREGRGMGRGGARGKGRGGEREGKGEGKEEGEREGKSEGVGRGGVVFVSSEFSLL